jgi:hypothetical protein
VTHSREQAAGSLGIQAHDLGLAAREALRLYVEAAEKAGRAMDALGKVNSWRQRAEAGLAAMEALSGAEGYAVRPQGEDRRTAVRLLAARPERGIGRDNGVELHGWRIWWNRENSLEWERVAEAEERCQEHAATQVRSPGPGATPFAYADQEEAAP